MRLLYFPPGEAPLADRDAHAALFELLAEEVVEEETERLLSVGRVEPLQDDPDAA